jgi:hypothetical protein
MFVMAPSLTYEKQPSSFPILDIRDHIQNISFSSQLMNGPNKLERLFQASPVLCNPLAYRAYL